MEYVYKINIFGLKMMVKSGLEIFFVSFLKFLQVLTILKNEFTS